METMLQRSDSTNFGGAGGGQRRSRRRRCLLLSCSCEAFRRPQKLCLMFWRTCAESEGHTSQAVSRLPWKHHLSALLHVFFFSPALIVKGQAEQGRSTQVSRAAVRSACS